MKTIIKGVLVGVQIILVLMIMREFVSNSTGYAVYDGDKASVEFYVMSQCPYGTQVEDAFYPVLNKFGDAIDFKLDFIGREVNGMFSSLHGQPEVEGNIIQLCVAKYYPETYMDMIICMNKNANLIPNNWENCAKGMDKEVLTECYEGEEGKSLLSESFKRAQTANAQGSPTMYFGGELYQGGRDEISFTRAVCQLLDNHPECAKIPECASNDDCPSADKNGFCRSGKCEYEVAQEVTLTIVNDKRCKTCDTKQLEGILKTLFKGIKVEYVDVSEQNELIKDLIVVPAFIFDERITETYTWKNDEKIQGAFEEKDGMYKIIDIATGANYIFDDEKRAIVMKEIGVDVNDNKPQVDFFVMSYCPYGNQADQIISEVYGVLGNKAKYIPRYVIYENYAGGTDEYCLTPQICSMHGIQELNQDIREKCVYEDLGFQKWSEFALAMNEKCNSGNADMCWKDVAKSLGLDASKIAVCESERGIELMTEDKRIQDLLGVSGSPTIFIEGQQYDGPRDANSILSTMCDVYENEPEECNDIIITQVNTVSQGSC